MERVVGRFADDPKMEINTTQQEMPAARNERLVLSVRGASQLLGISRAHGYELAARGELPVLHLGGRIVIPRVALLALVEKAGQGE